MLLFKIQVVLCERAHDKKYSIWFHNKFSFKLELFLLYQSIFYNKVGVVDISTIAIATVATIWYKLLTLRQNWHSKMWTLFCILFCLTLTTLAADGGQEQILHQHNINNFLITKWIRNNNMEIFLMNNFDSCVMIWNGNSFLTYYCVFIIGGKLYLSIYINSISFKELYIYTYVNLFKL
jgi:hypothetical protein